MKMGALIVGIVAALALSACGGGNETPNIATQNQADVAKATLQEKADALAREASMSPPPPAGTRK